MNLPTSNIAARITSAVLFTLVAVGGTLVHARADAPRTNRAVPSPSPSPSPSAIGSPCTDCPPIIIGHPKGGKSPDGIVVGPDELKIFPSPHPYNGHVYTISKSGAVTTVLEDGVAKMVITFRGDRAYIGLPGSKPLVVINVAP